MAAAGDKTRVLAPFVPKHVVEMLQRPAGAGAEAAAGELPGMAGNGRHDDDGAGDEESRGPVVDVAPSYMLNRRSSLVAVPPPACEVREGVVLLTDISGFTRKGAELCRDEDVGPELLTEFVNESFRPLIREIDRHGGDLFKFAGDALIVFFEGPSALQRAVLCAADCLGVTINIHCGIGRGTVYIVECGGIGDQREVMLCGTTLFESVATVLDEAQIGEIGLNHAAAQEAQGFLSATPYSQRLSTRSTAPLVLTLQAKAAPRMQGLFRGVRESFSVGHSRSGSVSSSVATQISDLQEVAEADGPMAAAGAGPGASLDSVDPAVLARYVPTTVGRRVLSGSSHDWLSEFRMCTIMFVSITGLRFDSPDALTKLNDATLIIQRAVDTLEGLLRQMLTDDKGLVAVLAFGVPPLAHEDDEARAIRAALQIRDQLHVIGLGGNFGLASGRVYAGVVGSEIRKDFAIVGDVVNLAARLMGKAKNDIYCHPSTASRAARLFELEALPPVEVKNIAEPVNVFRPVGFLQEKKSSAISSSTGSERFISFAAATTSSVIGRDQESKQLSELLDRAARGIRGGLVVIEGDAGMGKSMLVRQVTLQAASAALDTFYSAADGVERGNAFFLLESIFVDIVEALSQDSPNSGAALNDRVLELLHDAHQFSRFAVQLGKSTTLRTSASRRASVATSKSGQHGSSLVDFAALLNDLDPRLSLAAGAAVQGLHGNARISALANMLSALISLRLSRTDRKSALLVFEDAQHADSASFLVLEYILRMQPALLVLVTARPSSDVGDEVKRIIHRPTATRIVLPPLSQMDMKSLLLSLSRARDASPQILNKLVESSRGNPFFFTELVQSMLDAKTIEVDDDDMVTWAAGKTAGDVQLPRSIESIVTRQIDQLADRAALTLKVCSVIGRFFTSEAALAVFPEHESSTLDETALAANLHLCIKAGLVAKDPLRSTGNTRAYYFQQSVTRDVAYGQLLGAQRANLHRAAGNYFEAAGGSPHLVAHHFALAYRLGAAEQRTRDLTIKIAQAAALAGEQALQSRSVSEARTQLLVALEFWDLVDGSISDELRLAKARTYFVLGKAHHANGLMVEALRAQRMAVETLREPVPTSPIMVALGLAWELYRFTKRMRHMRKLKEQEADRLARTAPTERPGGGLPVISSGTPRQGDNAGTPDEEEPLRVRWAMLHGLILELLTQASFLAGDKLGTLRSALRASNVLMDAGVENATLFRMLGTSTVAMSVMGKADVMQIGLDMCTRFLDRGKCDLESWGSIAFTSGIVMVNQGQMGDQFYDLLEGQIATRRNLEDWGRFLESEQLGHWARLVQGDYLPESSSLIESTVRIADENEEQMCRILSPLIISLQRVEMGLDLDLGLEAVVDLCDNHLEPIRDQPLSAAFCLAAKARAQFVQARRGVLQMATVVATLEETLATVPKSATSMRLPLAWYLMAWTAADVLTTWTLNPDHNPLTAAERRLCATIRKQFVSKRHRLAKGIPSLLSRMDLVHAIVQLGQGVAARRVQKTLRSGLEHADRCKLSFDRTRLILLAEAAGVPIASHQEAVDEMTGLLAVDTNLDAFFVFPRAEQAERFEALVKESESGVLVPIG